MGNLIVAGDFIDLESATITVRSEDSNHPKENVYDYWHLKKDFRAQDATKNDWLLKANLGAATEIAAILLNDVNFDKVTIQGNATDSWGSPSFSENHSISKDARVQRYKAYCALTSFNYQWLRIFIPSDANLVGDLSVWAMGSIVLLKTDTGKTITLNPNICYGYTYTAEKPFKDNEKEGGSKERIGLGQNAVWKGEIPFGRRTPSDEAQLWALNALDIAEPLVLYENEGYTQYAYLCLRDDHVEITREKNRILQVNTIHFMELI